MSIPTTGEARPLFIVSCAGGGGQLSGYAQNEVAPYVHSLGYRGVLLDANPGDLYSGGEQIYETTITLALDKLDELLPRATGLLVVNAHVRSDGRIANTVYSGSNREISEAHAALRLGQVGLARGHGVPAYAVDLGQIDELSNPGAFTENILRIQMRAMGAKSLNGQLNRLPPPPVRAEHEPPQYPALPT